MGWKPKSFAWCRKWQLMGRQPKPKPWSSPGALPSKLPWRSGPWCALSAASKRPGALDATAVIIAEKPSAASKAEEGLEAALWREADARASELSHHVPFWKAFFVT